MKVRIKFGLTSVLVTLAVLSNLLLMLSLLPSADAQVRGRLPERLDWQTYQVPEFGTTVDYPAGIFSSADGKAEMEIRKLMDVEDFGEGFTASEELAKVKF